MIRKWCYIIRYLFFSWFNPKSISLIISYSMEQAMAAASAAYPRPAAATSSTCRKPITFPIRSRATATATTIVRKLPQMSDRKTTEKPIRRQWEAISSDVVLWFLYCASNRLYLYLIFFTSHLPSSTDSKNLTMSLEFAVMWWVAVSRLFHSISFECIALTSTNDTQNKNRPIDGEGGGGFTYRSK